ncbi:uncharacterized protein EI97DRAFT_189686 [Westerdykella ornata]|uniref:Aminodeoxychorismate lyase n=1 Tax=Westerdykella ornata TaxID=318751 RepID=A0A6A6JA36_WESOR|nr:uncharacterized protein EI97DRAFT_189686 [Westerdykella ornata]KAF2273094.1 hypothetical protein EI97DRAFT_189686 [Westerdykella ornata]
MASSSQSTSEESFLICTALRYDPLLLGSIENSRPALNFVSPSPFYMLVYHRDRLLEAAQHFEFPAVVDVLQDGEALHKAILKEVERHVEETGKDVPLKVRVLFEKSGKMIVDLAPVAATSLQNLYPASLDPPGKRELTPHPAQRHAETKAFEPSALTGGALELGPTDSLPSQASPAEWLLRLDKDATPSSPFTLLKTTVRDLYNTSRARALPTNPQNPRFVEVILYNECNELTEGTVTSLYFFRGGRWVTPPVGVPAGAFTATTLKEGDGEGWDEGELRKPFAGRWGHSVRSSKVGAGGQRGTTRRWALIQGMCMEETVGVDTVQVGERVWVSNGVVGFGFGRVVD